MNNFGSLGYFFQFIVCFCFDRFTKMWALHTIRAQEMVISNFLSFSFCWNRGVSWSFFNDLSGLWYALLTTVIVLVIVFFAGYTLAQYRNKRCVFFEVMVLAGALSNVVDRFIYGAVIDFIELHMGTFYWPTFNLADALIVVGVVGIIIKQVYNTYVCKN